MVRLLEKLRGSTSGIRTRWRAGAPRHFVVPHLEALEPRTVPSYVFQTLTDPLATFGPFPIGINAQGQVVGYYFDAKSHEHGFLMSGGQYTSIDVPGSAGTGAVGINERGQIVGSFTDATGNVHGFLLTGEKFTTLDVPGAVLTGGVGINNRGQIVGGYFDADFNGHAFLLSGGQYSTIDPTNSSGFYAEADGINASGQIVGSYLDNGFNVHGFLLSGSQGTNLDDPNGVTTNAFGINAAGQIAGNYVDANVNFHGYLFSGGQYTTLDDPNGGSGASQGTLLFGINDGASVVGMFIGSNRVIHGFLATPTNDSSVSTGAAASLAIIGSAENSSAPNLLLLNTLLPTSAAMAAADGSPTIGGAGSYIPASADGGISSLVLSTPAGIQVKVVSTVGSSISQPMWDLSFEVDALSFDPWNVPPPVGR
jgi:probable HAF family extracellular repeat protein